MDTAGTVVEFAMAHLVMNLPLQEKAQAELDRVIGLNRRMTESDLIGGYDIPKDATVQVNVWAIGRDLGIWEDPLEFKPERFLEMDVDIKTHDFRMLPFGAGRRICPAAQLSSNFVSLMVGSLLHQFKWMLPEGVKPEDIDLSENPGLVSYMARPLEVVPVLRLSPKLYSHEGL
ncbi:hypothetical protein ACFE04_009184 [Oxalis oulophora]